MEDCIFCKIARKEIPVSIVYEDEDFLAFPDINPQAKKHVLLIPKQHLDSISELSDTKLAGKLLLTATKIAKLLNIDKSGYRVVINTGKDAGQSVHHLHLHIIGGQTLGQIA